MEGINSHFERSKKEISSLALNIISPPLISKAEQNAIIQDHGRNLATGEFFFTVEILNSRISNARGVADVLGYTDSQFGLRDYILCFLEQDIDLLALESRIVMSNCLKGTYAEAGFMKGYFSVCHGLRKRNGERIYVHRTSVPFQINKDHQITEYLNRFRVIGPYLGQAYTSNTVDLPDDYLKMLRIEGGALRLDKPIFSAIQEKMLKYHLKKLKKLPNSEEAGLLDINLESYKTNKRRIKEKVLPYTEFDSISEFTFETAVEVVRKYNLFMISNVP